MYDQNNIFARILRKEIPASIIHETPHTLAFADIKPAAPIHVLVIPKGAYMTFTDFAEKASHEEMADFMKSVAQTAKKVGATEGGYRLISNAGANAHQEVPHFHVHILAGRALGPLLGSELN